MSKIEVDKVDPQSGTALEIGTSGDTVTVPSGVGLTLTNSTLLLPTTINTDKIDPKSGTALEIGTSGDTITVPTGAGLTVTDEVKTNKISPATGTAFTLGDSGDTFTVPSGATIVNSGTATGFGGGAWIFIKSQTASNVASIEFKNGVSDVILDSTYPLYKVIGYDIVPITDDSNIQIQFSTDTGASYITSGYSTIVQRMRDDADDVLAQSTTTAMNLSSVGTAANEEGAFEFTLVNPSSASTFAKYWFDAVTRDASARVCQFNGGGMYEATSDIDALKIMQSSGNISSGTYKLYGLSGS